MRRECSVRLVQEQGGLYRLLFLSLASSRGSVKEPRRSRKGLDCFASARNDDEEKEKEKLLTEYIL